MIFQFIVTKYNKLYTWGASPQLIRLNNQARKRAKLAQKFEEAKSEIMGDSSTSDLNENFQKKPADDVSNEEVENRKNNEDSTCNASTSFEDSNQNILHIDNKVNGTTSKSATVEKTYSGANEPIDNKESRDEGQSAKAKESKRLDELASEEECTEHLYPMAVDTSDIIGNIVQVSCWTTYIIIKMHHIHIKWTFILETTL